RAPSSSSSLARSKLSARGWEAAMSDPVMTIEQIADALRDLPRPSFRKRLKAELLLIAERTGHMTTVIENQRATAGRQTAAPRLRLKNAAAAIEFYTRAFGARELMRFEG